MHFQKSVIALAIGASLAAHTAFASPLVSEAKRDLGTFDFDSGFALIDDASLDIKLRMVAYNRDSYNKPMNDFMKPAASMYTQAERRDAGLAVWADFQSGWMWDFIGFDISAQGAKALQNDGFAPTTQLWEHNDIDTISRIGVANIKFRGGNETLGFDGRVGRMIPNLPMIAPEMDSALPQVLEGALINGHYKMVSGYVARMEKAGHYQSSQMDKMGTDINVNPFTGVGEFKEIPLEMAGITLGKPGESANIGIHYGEQQDYLKKWMVKAEAGLPMGEENFLIGSLVYHKQEGGKYYNPFLGGKNYEADMYALNLTGLMGDNLMLRGGYSQVGDEAYNVTFTNELYNRTNHTTMIWNDFNHAEMKSVMFGGVYKLSAFGLDDVSLLAQAAYGWDAKATMIPMPMNGLLPLTDDYAWEGVIGATYEVFDGPLQGLWLNVSYNKDGGGYSNTHGGRVILDYTVKVF
ncbi:OprD family outer membrane porin [Parendozoicomonas haliclonae]|uniref:Outer membrane porin, OprD family n=1 Tax=Parendozoicomonas haliclonae TaxID=1960125 RepID=A0A1X7AR95_9GAMM|nr:OprD family outer membrane porin [Parendozoicomonas haliclonae]SMA50841.1 outer membrane porin, OprD family [Parendozoicomonas haliclonae]